jgi:tetratricopeptide (TPR) repeat protein
VVAGGAAAGFIGLRFRHLRRLNHASALIAQDRAGEAEVLLKDLMRARFLYRPNRALVRHNLATCMALRGDHGAALELARQARDQAARVSRFHLYRAVIAYQEIRLLAELGRAQEARIALDAAGDAPEGEYLRVAHWTTELSVHLAENVCPLDDDELHERARKGLAMTTGSVLLGLCGWAFSARGDDDMATHLVTEAFDRIQPERLARMAPRLYQWMSAHRAEHPPEADPF